MPDEPKNGHATLNWVIAVMLFFLIICYGTTLQNGSRISELEKWHAEQKETKESDRRIEKMLPVVP